MTQLIEMIAAPQHNTTQQATALRTAKLSDFRAPTPKLLFGERLKEITDLETSIAKHGLMMPLMVTRSGGKLVVIDGRKRLAALRRMRFKNTLPRSLVNIPFVMNTEPVPHILSAQEQYRDMMALKKSGLNLNAIMETLCLSAAQTRALMSINRLSPRLKTAFLNTTITLEQASAFAVLPRPEAQDSVLLSVGPFAAPDDILRAAKKRSGAEAALQQTAINTAADNVITMPMPPLTGLASQTPLAA